MPVPSQGEAIGPPIAHDGQLRIGQLVQDARVIRPPGAEPDEGESNALPGGAAIMRHRAVNSKSGGYSESTNASAPLIKTGCAEPRHR